MNEVYSETLLPRGVREHPLDVIVHSYTGKLVIPVAWSPIHLNLKKEIYWEGPRTYFPKSNRCPHHSGLDLANNWSFE